MLSVLDLEVFHCITSIEYDILLTCPYILL